MPVYIVPKHDVRTYVDHPNMDKGRIHVAPATTIPVRVRKPAKPFVAPERLLELQAHINARRITR